jgi:hypothetical protein
MWTWGTAFGLEGLEAPFFSLTTNHPASGLPADAVKRS